MLKAKYTVRHKKLHPCYWYNNFAKICHIVMIFGIYMYIRISPACLRVLVKSKTENQLIRFFIAYLVADNNVKYETVAAT